MAKRFTDTEKWDDEWFLGLPNDHKIVWQYICDKCSIAGVLKKNFKLMNFCCDTKLDEKSFLKIFNSRILEYDSFFFIPKFLKFQYPNGLKSNQPAIKTICKELELRNLTEKVIELYGEGYLNGKTTHT